MALCLGLDPEIWCSMRVVCASISFRSCMIRNRYRCFREKRRIKVNQFPNFNFMKISYKHLEIVEIKIVFEQKLNKSIKNISVLIHTLKSYPAGRFLTAALSPELRPNRTE